MCYYLPPFVAFCMAYPPNPGPVQIHKFNDTSSLGAYEPFCSSSPQTKVRIALLKACSVCNKSAAIYNRILENCLDILCITETWINNGDISSSLLSLLPPKYDLAQHYGWPLSICSGSMVLLH